jgi:hypothetical protein
VSFGWANRLVESQIAKSAAEISERSSFGKKLIWATK